jgi:hypothetical protein
MSWKRPTSSYPEQYLRAPGGIQLDLVDRQGNLFVAPTPLRYMIITALHSAIVTGITVPGAGLIEQGLCTRLSLGRTSLREPLCELQADRVFI